MGENVVLAAFAAAPLLVGWGLKLFFRTHRLHKRGGWRLLLAGNTLVFVFLCSIAILAGEVYYRFVYDSTDSFGLTKTTVRWFKRHFETNSIGLRDSIDYQRTIAADRRRVSFLGDSFAAGHGISDVEDRFPNIVRRLLPACEVHALAVCAWDTGNELSSLRSICDDGYELDLVVLAYCLNDISDISTEWQSVLRRIDDFSSSPGVLVENSYFCNTAYYRYRSAHDPDISNYYQFVEDLYRGPTWERQQRRLLLLRDDVERRGGRLLVVTFPFYNALGPEYRYDGIHDLLDRWWRENGVPNLDLRSVYGPYRADELTVSRHDAHPNELAHAVAAEAIAGFLVREGGAELRSDAATGHANGERRVSR